MVTDGQNYRVKWSHALRIAEEVQTSRGSASMSRCTYIAYLLLVFLGVYAASLFWLLTNVSGRRVGLTIKVDSQKTTPRKHAEKPTQ